MTQAEINKQATALMNYYAKLYSDSHGSNPMFNRAIEKWAARELIESFGAEGCREALDWYFKVNKHHDWKAFVRSAGTCLSESRSVHADFQKRKALKAVALEWRNR